MMYVMNYYNTNVGRLKTPVKTSSNRFKHAKQASGEAKPLLVAHSSKIYTRCPTVPMTYYFS